MALSKFDDPLVIDSLSYINFVQWDPSLTPAPSHARAAPYWVVTDDSGIPFTLGSASFNGSLEPGVSVSSIRQRVTTVPRHLPRVVDFTANRCFSGAPEISKISLAKLRFHPMANVPEDAFFGLLQTALGVAPDQKPRALIVYGGMNDALHFKTSFIGLNTSESPTPYIKEVGYFSGCFDRNVNGRVIIMLFR